MSGLSSTAPTNSHYKSTFSGTLSGMPENSKLGFANVGSGPKSRFLSTLCDSKQLRAAAVGALHNTLAEARQLRCEANEQRGKARYTDTSDKEYLEVWSRLRCRPRP